MAKRLLSQEIEEALSCFSAALEDATHAERAYDIAVFTLATTRCGASQRVRQVAKDAKEKVTEAFVDALVMLDETVITAEADVIEQKWLHRRAVNEADTWRERLRFMRLAMQQTIGHQIEVTA